MLRQAWRFAAVGLVNTGVSLAMIFAVMALLGVSPALANAIGYALGFALSFVLHRTWTFGSSERAAVLLPGYLAAVAVCYGLNLLGVIVAISYLRVHPFVAQFVGVAVYTPSLFAMSRWWVFRRRETIATAPR